MRIALLTDGIYPNVIGGMQKHSFLLAKYLAANGVFVDLYHTLPPGAASKSEDPFSVEERRFIRLILVEYPRPGHFPGHYLREMRAYSKRLAERMDAEPSVDFVYVQGLCGLYFLDGPGKRSAPVGVNFHGLEMFQKAADLRSWAEQRLFRRPVMRCFERADVVFSLGGKLTELLLKNGVAPDKIRETPIGIDGSWMTETNPSNRAIRSFIFVGRYERRKGIQELSAVASRLAGQHRFQLTFVGGIPADKRITGPGLRYTGSISGETEMRDLLAEADVLICPSFSEGMPTVILEAMGSGLAVIASDVGAVSELVDSSNGILIRPGDQDNLEEAMKCVIGMSDDHLLTLKRHAIARASAFTWEKVILITIDAVKSTCLRKGGD